MRQQKILFFVNNAHTYSGAAFQAINLAKFLKHDICIVNSGSMASRTNQDELKIINLNKNLFLKFIQLILMLSSPSVRAVHFHGHFLLPMFVAWLMKKKYLIKTTLMGTDDFLSLNNSKFGAARLFLSRRATVNIALSQKLKSINQKLAPELIIKVIPNGVILPEFQLGVGDKKNWFYYCGAVSRRKNTLAAIEYFHINYAQIEGSILYVIGPIQDYGGGADFDNTYVLECHNYVDSNGLIEKVIFTGFLADTKIREISKKCKALIFFSSFEGMPNVVLEAMAMNCVPIISDMHGVAFEILGDYLYKKILGQNLSLKEIDELIEENTIRQRVVNNFEMKKITERYEFLYTQFIGRY